MDKLKAIQNNSVRNSSSGIGYNQVESMNIEKDNENLQNSNILDLLQLEDEQEYTCDGTHTNDSLHKKNENKNGDVVLIGCDRYYIKEDINLINDLKKNKCSVDKKEKKSNSSKELDEHFEVSEFFKKFDKDEIEHLDRVKKRLPHNEIESLAQALNSGKDLLSSEYAEELLKAMTDFSKISTKIFTSDKDSIEKEKKELKMDNPNICLICNFESNNVKERIEHTKTRRHEIGLEYLSFFQNENDPNTCRVCGFSSENLEDRIKHVKDSRHEGAQEAKKAISYRILEKYTTNTFYCTVCSWFVTDFEPLIEHILSSSHKKAAFLYQNKKYALLELYLSGEIYCKVCKCIVSGIVEHLRSHYNKYRFSFKMGECNSAKYCDKYRHYNKSFDGILRINFKGEVFCTICNISLKSLIDIDEIYNHMKNEKHDDYIKCDKKESSIDSVHGNERFTPEISMTHKEAYDIFPAAIENSNRKEIGENFYSGVNPSYDSSLPRTNSNVINRNITFHESNPIVSLSTKYKIDNEYKSKKSNSPLKCYYKDYENKYRSNTSKEISKKYFESVKDKISNPHRNVEVKSRNRQTSSRSKSTADRFGPKVEIKNSPRDVKNKCINHHRSSRSTRTAKSYGSRSPTHRKHSSSISNSISPSGRDPMEEHAYKSPLNQPSFTCSKTSRISNSSSSFIDIDSDDEDEELNIITCIMKLLRLCDQLGNLGSFFAINLKKALERKEFTDEVLDILREPANIILMDVLCKKLKAFETSVYNRRISKKFVKGIMYLTFLTDATKYPESCNFSQDFSSLLESKISPSNKTSKNKPVTSHLSVTSAKLIASNVPTVSIKSIKLCHGVNVEEIAKVTAGKTVDYTINFIKSILKNINERIPTRDVVSDIILAVSNEHFKMLSDT